MKTNALLITLLLTCTGLCAVAQDESAEQIVAKYASLCAEKGYLDTIRTTRITARAVVQSDTIRLLILKEAGRFYYMKITTASAEEVRVYHQGSAAVLMGGNKEVITDAAELDEMKLQAHILPDVVYKNMGYKMDLEGISKLDGVEYYIVKLQSPNGFTKTNYYEKETGLLRIIIDSRGTKQELPEYVKFKGGLYPKRNIVHFPEGGSLEIVMEEITNNEKIDPALFRF